MSDKVFKEITALSKRLERLEAIVLPKGKTTTTLKSKENYSGPKGGVELLISKGFFSKKHSAAEVHAELEKNGYIGYRRSVIQTALNRLSEAKGQLIASTEQGVKIYAKRK